MTFSIIIETENLALGGVDDLRRCLDTLVNQTRSVADAEEVVILVGGHLADDLADGVRRDFPFVSIYRHNGDLTYLGAKRLGAQRATGDIVVYADSDCAYEPTWLAETLAAFEAHPDAGVACSDTRIASDSLYGLAMQIAWIMPTLRQSGSVQQASSFRLNNFAIRRQIMLDSIFDDEMPLYRGAILFWWQRLRNAGIKFYRVPKVMAWHLPPQGVQEWFSRLLVLGADHVAGGDYEADAKGFAVHRPSLARRLGRFVALIPRRLSRLVRAPFIIVAERPASLPRLVASLPLAVLATIVVLAGGAWAIMAPGGAYKRISALEAAGG